MEQAQKEMRTKLKNKKIKIRQTKNQKSIVLEGNEEWEAKAIKERGKRREICREEERVRGDQMPMYDRKEGFARGNGSGWGNKGAIKKITRERNKRTKEARNMN